MTPLAVCLPHLIEQFQSCCQELLFFFHVLNKAGKRGRHSLRSKTNIVSRANLLETALVSGESDSQLMLCMKMFSPAPGKHLGMANFLF